MFLAVEEKADEAVGVFFKDCFSAGEKAAVSNGVVVEGFRFLFDETEGEFGAETKAFLFGVLEFEDFEDRFGVVVDVTRVGVVVAHEGLDPTENRFLRVVEFIGEDALEAEGENVVSFVVVVECVTDAVEEVEGVFEFASGKTTEDVSSH